MLTWRKKILKNNGKTKAYLDSLEKLWVVFLWADYGIIEVPWTGKYNREGLPLVYNYYDNNGCCDEFRLVPINHVSSGQLISWYRFTREAAERAISSLRRNNMKTRYTKFKSMSIEELAKWIDDHGQHDDSPWMTWFDNKYCSRCESEIVKREDSMSKLGFELLFRNETECSYCEVYDECRFFQNKKNPGTQEIIEMWLKEAVDE